MDIIASDPESFSSAFSLDNTAEDIFSLEDNLPPVPTLSTMTASQPHKKIFRLLTLGHDGAEKSAAEVAQAHHVSCQKYSTDDSFKNIIQSSHAVLFLVEGSTAGEWLDEATEYADSIKRENLLKSPLEEEDILGWLNSLPEELDLAVFGTRENEFPGIGEYTRKLFEDILPAIQGS